MKNRLLLLFLSFVFSFNGFAQTDTPGDWCDTEYPEYMFEYVEDATRDFLNGIQKSNVEYQIPVTLHNMRSTNATGGSDIADVLPMFCEIVEGFEPYGIHLYLHELKQHNSTGWTDDGALATTVFLTKEPNTVNMYLFTQLTGGSGLCGYYLGNATSPGQTEPMGADVIAINTNSVCGDDVGVLIHEMGHYFGLPHTFFGFEGTGNNCGVYVTNGERVDGSNCSTAADRICDTSPNNNALAPGSCPDGMLGCLQYDRDSVAFYPDATNYMSYFLDCISSFTDGQEMVMKGIIENLRDDLLVLPAPDDLQPVTETPNLQLPGDGASRPYDIVDFTWEAVPNATKYYFEINRAENFSQTFRVESAILDANQYTSTILQPSLTYYWRVLAYNEMHTCIDEYSSRTLNTQEWTVSNEQVEGIESVNISPNPAFSGQPVTLEVQSSRQMNGTLNVYKVNGQLVHETPVSIGTSNDSFTIDTKSLSAGLYVVHLEFEEGIIQKKFIVN